MIAVSAGLGVQSTTMLLMAAHREITPMPDCAIFADTLDEPAAVYEHLRWLQSPNVLPFPIHVTSRGQLSADLLAGDDAARIPFFVKGSGLAGRQCTRNYKIRPIRQKARELFGASRRGRIPAAAIEVWVGISLDEADRMKPSGVAFMVNRFPLIEQRMSRQDCKRWLVSNDYPVPVKSACTYCPFQEDGRHRDRQANDPEAHARNIAFDLQLRTPENVARFRGEVYVHRSCRPLSEVDFLANGDLFANECEGGCGL